MNISNYLIQSPNPPMMCGISRSSQSQAPPSTTTSLILQPSIQQWQRINSCQEPGKNYEQDTAPLLQSFQSSRRLQENWQSNECYREWMQVLWELMEGLGKAPLNKEYWTSRWNDGELVEQGVGRRAPQVGGTAYIKQWLEGNVWCQALKEVQDGREIRVRRNTGVTHGRPWNLGSGSSEKLLKFLRRIWVFIFLVTFSAVGRIGWKECRETLWGQGAGRDGNFDKSRQKRVGDSIKGWRLRQKVE